MQSPSLVRSLCACLAIAIVTIFSGCGGGGGEGSGAGAASFFELSDSSVSFSGFRGGYAPAAKSVTLNVKTTRTVYVSVTFSGAAVANADLVIVDAVSGVARVDIFAAPTNGAGLVNGNNSGIVTVRGCYDLACTDEIPQSPKVVQVSYNLQQVVDTSELSFTSIEGGAAPSAKIVNLDIGAANNQSWSTGVQYLLGSGWLHLSKSSGSSFPDMISVSVDPMASGIYQAQLTIATDGITHHILITYRVDGTLGVSSSPTFALTSSSTFSDLSKVITVVSNDGAVPAIDWAASVDVPWLSLSPNSGNTVGTNQLTVSLVGSQMAGLDGRSTTGELLKHNATITLSASGYSSVSVPVQLTLELPTLRVVSPNAVVDGSETEIILRGQGLASATGVSFDGAASISVSPRNDSEIRLTAPPLGLGSHSVSVPNELGIARKSATYYAVPSTAFSTNTIARSGEKNSLVYDPVRKALYVANAGLGTLDKFTYSEGSGSWNLTSEAVASIDKLSLSMDGAYLLVTTTTPLGYMYEIDPDDLHVVATSSYGEVSSIGFDSLNEAILAKVSAYATEAMRAPRNSAMGILYPSMYNVFVGTCGDGRRALVGSSGGADYVYYFDAGSALNIYPVDMSATGIKLGVSSIIGDRTGSKWILNKSRIYGSNIEYLYSLPSTTIQSILSPDGSVAYAIASDGYLYRFNLGSNLVEAGSMALPVTPGASPVMAISNDGNTLFIAGDQNLIIMSAP